MKDNFGGNRISLISPSEKGRHQFATGEYEYFMHSTEGGDLIDLSMLESCTVYVLSADKDTEIKLTDGEPSILKQGDTMQIEGQKVKIRIRNGKACFLVAGVESTASRPIGRSITPRSGLYRVDKPWGYELWLNGEHPAYCLKEIALKAGAQTSLQYHNKKKETNVLMEGDAYIHYKKNDSAKNDSVNDSDIGRVKICAMSAVDVEPNIIHRVESVTDILLYETSTPHLDDVVRISDDSNRPDGRIGSEHNN